MDIMDIIWGKKASKYFFGLDEWTKIQILRGIKNLEKEPPEGDIKKLKGTDEYRLRIGDYRLIYRILNKEIRIHELTTRGHAYRR